MPDRRSLDRLGSLLARSGSTSALVLAPAGRVVAGRGGGRAGGAASVRLAGGRAATSSGSGCAPVVERHRWALAGGSAELDLWFGEGRRIDPLVAALAEPRPLVAERPALRVVSA